MSNYNAINIKLEIYNDDALDLQQDLHWYLKNTHLILLKMKSHTQWITVTSNN